LSNTQHAALVRVPLPTTREFGPDQWADIRDPYRVTRGDRKKIMSASRGAARAVAEADGDLSKVDDEVTTGAGIASLDAVFRLWVVAWSLTRADGTPLPIPRDLSDDELDELNMLVSNPIERRLAPVMEIVTAELDTEPSSDPQSPSVPSAA